MKITTYNLRCVWAHDGINSFVHRAGLVYEVIEREKPDVIGFQEMTARHLALLERLMPDYCFYGQLREADYTGEGVYIAVRKDAFLVLFQETIWLSPTPYAAGSRFEIQSRFPRTCVAIQLRHKTTGQMLRVFNLHLDHKLEEARIAGMRCVLSYLREQNQKLPLPSVILGDFNAEPDSATIAMCREFEQGALCDLTEQIPVTFHGFGGCEPIKIDYIFASRSLAETCMKVTPWTDTLNGIYLSDHYPVCAEFTTER